MTGPPCNQPGCRAPARVNPPVVIYGQVLALDATPWCDEHRPGAAPDCTCGGDPWSQPTMTEVVAHLAPTCPFYPGWIDDPTVTACHTRESEDEVPRALAKGWTVSRRSEVKTREGIVVVVTLVPPARAA